MTDEKQENQGEDIALVGGPGRQLREAREARKLSPQQVASQLRMQVRIIEALESDDYSSLPGSTFVQGYLRSYSRLLGLPEESVVALSRSDSVDEPKLVSSITEGKIEATSRDLPMRMTSFLILVTIVSGLGWWLSQRSPATDTAAPQTVVPGAEQGLRLPEETVQLQPDEQPVADEGESAVAAEEAVAGDTAEATVEESASPDLAQAAIDESASPELAESESPVAESPSVVNVIPAATPEVTLSAETPQSQLVVEYQADSWSEIQDAAGRQLTYGLVPAGSHLTLQGEAPFKVFLGFAAGVTVYYNGVLYDHTPYHRGDVARFRIGRAEHNRPVSGN